MRSRVLRIAATICLLGIALIAGYAFESAPPADVSTDPTVLGKYSALRLTVDGVKLGDNITAIPQALRIGDQKALDHLTKPYGSICIMTKDALFTADISGRISGISMEPTIYDRLNLHEASDVERVFGKPDRMTRFPSAVDGSDDAKVFTYQEGRLVVSWSASRENVANRSIFLQLQPDNSPTTSAAK